MCTFEINKENVFLWNKYFLFQKHFDQMSKIFQDQEHLSKKSCYNFFISNDPVVSQHGLGGSETKRWQKLISNETNSGLSRSRKQRTFYALLIFGCRGIDFWWTWRDRSRGRRGSIFAIIHPTLTCVCVTLVKVTRCDCWASTLSEPIEQMNYGHQESCESVSSKRIWSNWDWFNFRCECWGKDI